MAHWGGKGYKILQHFEFLRESLGYEKALREIEDNRGTQYNDQVASAFLSQGTPDLHARIKAASQKPLAVIAQELIHKV